MSILRGRLLKRGGDVFKQERDLSFYIKTKLKSEILNNKKNLQTKMFIGHNWKFKLTNFN